jgi:hypothetical protein
VFPSAARLRPAVVVARGSRAHLSGDARHPEEVCLTRIELRDLRLCDWTATLKRRELSDEAAGSPVPVLVSGPHQFCDSCLGGLSRRHQVARRRLRRRVDRRV